MRSVLIIACFFASGAAGLILEIAWIRRCALSFGSTAAAVSTVLAVFFGGLALGSWLLGRAAQRSARPLRLYAIVELALAGAALLSLPALGAADAAYGGAYRALAGHPALLGAVRVALVALAILPATVLMGGTLPIMSRAFVVASTRIAGRVGFLYGLNTLGAAAGCALAGFAVLPAIGLRGSIILAAAIDGAAGAVVLLAARGGAAALPAARSDRAARRSAARLQAPPAAVAGASGAGTRALVGAMFFATGFVALGAEVVWTRHLALLVPNTVHTYTITLTAVLVGIVLGSWLAAAIFDRNVPRALAFGVIQVVLAWVLVAIIRLPPAAWSALAPAGESAVVIAIAVLLPAAVLSGATFPLAVRMVLDDPAQAGGRVGAMAALNTAGGIAGALAAGFVGLRFLGVDATARGLSAVALVVAMAAGGVHLRAAEPARRAVAVASLALLGLAGWVAIPRALPTRVPADFLAPPDRLVAWTEGRTADLAVVRNGDFVQLEIDRWWQGESRRNHQAMTAHVPMLLHPQARDVLVVGLGTGQTPGRFLLHPIARLDCVDLEPALDEFVRAHFGSAWMDDPRVRIIAEDGRSHIAHSRSAYDVVSLELGQLFRPGVASFYTRDFYEHAAARLRPGGVVTQLVPLPFLGEDALRRVLRTFLAVFPRSMLWYNTSELLLVGVSAERIAIDLAALADRMAEPAVQADLAYAYWGGREHFVDVPERFLAGFLCGPRGLAALTGAGPILRDDRPYLEYATRQATAAERNEIALVPLLEAHLEPVATILAAAPDPAAAAAIAGLRDANVRDMMAHANLRVVESGRGTIDPDRAIALLAEALAWNPANFAVHRQMADTCASIGRLAAAEHHFQAALALRPADLQSRRGLAYVLIMVGRPAEAIAPLEGVVAAAPNDSAARGYLGVALAQTGDLDRAVAEFREVVRLVPGDAEARENLARAERALRGASP